MCPCPDAAGKRLAQIPVSYPGLADLLEHLLLQLVDLDRLLPVQHAEFLREDAVRNGGKWSVLSGTKKMLWIADFFHFLRLQRSLATRRWRWAQSTRLTPVNTLAYRPRPSKLDCA